MRQGFAQSTAQSSAQILDVLNISAHGDHPGRHLSQSLSLGADLALPDYNTQPSDSA